MEYELLDTGVFGEDRYFDVFVEYAKGTPEDLLIQITVHNRGPEAAPLDVLPTLWFRNTWNWHPNTARPLLQQAENGAETGVVVASHFDLGDRYLYCHGTTSLLFTENETNRARIFGETNPTPYVKDSIDEFVVHKNAGAVNPGRTGTKAAAHYQLSIPAGGSATLRLRLSNVAPAGWKKGRSKGGPFVDFDTVMAARRQEADAFYEDITPAKLEGTDAARVMRQALAGMLWTKQYYYFDLDRWLEEHGSHPMGANRQKAQRSSRNQNWFHMINADIISMPDKWEYPWYAAWDLAFHCVALAMVDIDFAKHQLDLMLRELYLHPSGQIPAYEWNFSDVNPPVHAWATLFIYSIEEELRGKGDQDWLAGAFQKLLLNFTWWVNRKDPSGRNVFEGGFLGLDNIGVFDRSAPLPTGGYLEQADGTAWMAFFSQAMLQIALQLAESDDSYINMAVKFVEHFLWIASAMDRMGDNLDEMWDDEDGFYYDLLRLPDGQAMRLKVRSMVGLLPLCASTVFPVELTGTFASLGERVARFINHHPETVANIAPLNQRVEGGPRLLAILNEEKLRRVLACMLDEQEFLSPYGIRALSRYHLEHPYIFHANGQEYRVDYLPAESNTGMFGGNSNWRGPIWMPVNVLLVRALVNLYRYYGDSFTVECPTGSGRYMNLFEVSEEIARRLGNIFVRDEAGRRAVWGGAEKFQTDPHWRDYVLFYEYFHGDNGAGLGASHQTGWTGLVARLIQFYGAIDAKSVGEREIVFAASYLERDGISE
jgi:hypothetical protein